MMYWIWRGIVATGFGILLAGAAMAGPAGDGHQPVGSRLIEPNRDYGEEPGSIIKRFVQPLTEEEKRSHRSILITDDDHANSIAPVLTPKTPVYLHFSRQSGPNPEELNFILESGRIFLNYASPYKQEDAPTLRIRPIDGDCEIPFLIQVELEPLRVPHESGTLEILLHLPLIFNPEVTVNSVTLAQKNQDYRLSVGASLHRHKIVIPINKRILEPFVHENNGRLQILVDGIISLSKYRPIEPHRFSSVAKEDLDPRLAGISMIIAGRDYWGEHEKRQIMDLARQIEERTNKDYERILLANRYTSRSIRYFRNSMRRTAIQVLAEGIGDCDDYTRVMMALLRAMGIPCSLSVGHLYDFNSIGAHAWVDVGLPTRDGELRWFICDPTLASVTDQKDYFVQFNNRIYLYPVKIEVAARNLPVDERADILLNWRGKSPDNLTSPQAYHSTINSFRENLERSLQEKMDILTRRNLLPEREFLFDLGSSYFIVDRDVAPEKSRLQIKLDNSEQFMVELTVTDEEYSLEGAAEQEMADRIRRSYRRMKQLFFPDFEARYCLELSFERDKYTDQLQRVNLQVFRYLVEHHFDKIMDALEKEGLIRPEESARFREIYRICSGKNMYYILEMAHRQDILQRPIYPTEEQLVANQGD
ncbi:MAG: transglutaminase domain-containing protein [Acidobacteria bacterium]|nr:transglutaminase domain-containing protein [Acidobacteriota bacterium]